MSPKKNEEPLVREVPDDEIPDISDEPVLTDEEELERLAKEGPQE